MINKNYRLDRLKDNKRPKAQLVTNDKVVQSVFNKGDRVKLLEHDDYGVVFKGVDELNNVTVFYQDDYIQVNAKRLKLEFTADELYPAGYHLDTLFVDYETRKLEHDIERGSKKALKKIHKEIRQNNRKTNE